MTLKRRTFGWFGMKEKKNWHSVKNCKHVLIFLPCSYVTGYLMLGSSLLPDLYNKTFFLKEFNCKNTPFCNIIWYHICREAFPFFRDLKADFILFIVICGSRKCFGVVFHIMEFFNIYFWKSLWFLSTLLRF